MKLFAADLDTLQIAKIAGVNRNAVNRHLAAFRERIARFCKAESPVKGEVEVDESDFCFNHRNENIYKLVLNMLRENTLC